MQEGESSPQRPTTQQRDWTKGSVVKNLLSLSWPMMVSQSLNMMGPTIDMIWVGRLGAAAIAGVGVSGQAVMLANSVMMGLTMGARALVARYIGAGDPDGARHVARQAFAVCTSFAVVMVPIGIFLSEPILTAFGLEADVISEGAAYMRIMFVGAAFMTFRMMVEGIMQASGDSVTPMKISIIFRVIHVALAPFFIFGWWIFPDLGVKGAAVTNIISQGLGLSLGLWVLFSGRTRLRVTMSNFRVDLGIIRRIVRIGIPSTITSAQRGLGQLILMLFIVPYGTASVAAHTLVQRIEMFILMPGMGVGMGAGVLVGQNLGARQPGRAERSGWLAAAAVECFVVVCSISILLWAENIISVFSPGLEVVDVASVFLRIAVVGFIMFGLEPVMFHALSGAGDTLSPMIATVGSFWLIQIPLAYVLPRVTDLGVYGVRWGMATGMVGASIAMAIYFRLGRWKRKEV